MTNSSARVTVPGRIRNGNFEQARGFEYHPTVSLSQQLKNRGIILASRGNDGTAVSVPAIANHNTLIATISAIYPAAGARQITISVGGITFSFAGGALNDQPTQLGFTGGYGLANYPDVGTVLDVAIVIEKQTGNLKAFINDQEVDAVTGTGALTLANDTLQFEESTANATGAVAVADFMLRGE